MTNWTTDVHGNRFFNHAGWTVRIWSPEWTSGRISVESPHNGEEVDVWPEGICVRGESGGGWEGPSPSSVTIPWAVIGAVIEARAIVG